MANFMDLVMANLRGEPAPTTVATTSAVPAAPATTSPITPPGTPGATPETLGMTSFNNGQNWTNPAGAGLNASGALLPGYKYATYSNGVGQGTPQQIGDIGLLGQTVTGNAPPPAGSYNPNITAGPQTYARPGGMTGNTKPAPTGQSNILQRLAQALMARKGASSSSPTGQVVNLGNGIQQWQGSSGTPGQSSLGWDPSVLGKPATMGSSPLPSGNPYYSQLAQMLTQRFGGNGITSAGQNGLLKNNSLYSNYLK